jgi:SpoVK/Ycf46/Vps4 family AAA+-type ATPase
VLLLDEADGLLWDRRKAHHSWEITQVNELLGQMECFDGVFVCATNLVEVMDSAVLRRFQFKVLFDYLGPEQRLKWFVRTLAPAGCSFEDGVPASVRSRLTGLSNLTPGDFAAIASRWKLSEVRPTPDLLLDELTRESRLKPRGPTRAAGFTLPSSQR